MVRRQSISACILIDESSHVKGDTPYAVLASIASSTAAAVFQEQKRNTLNTFFWKRLNPNKKSRKRKGTASKNDANNRQRSETNAIIDSFGLVSDTPSAHCVFTPVVEQYYCGRCLVPVKQQQNSTRKQQQPETLTLDCLKFHKILGEGQFGQVWLASTKPVAQRREVCLIPKVYAAKVLSKYDLAVADPSTVDQLLTEVSILKELKDIHPCLIQMINAMQDDNLVYIVQEFCAGGELYSLVHNQDKESSLLFSQNVPFYAACLADAMHFLHKRGIIYRDLKPENVMIRQSTGYPVLIDFGLAKRLKPHLGKGSGVEDCDNHCEERCYSMVGTPKYVAPEVIFGGGYDLRADLWTLGVTIYELLARYNPMEGPLTDDDQPMDEVELFRCITEEDYVPLPRDVAERTPSAVQLIDALLARDPKNRLASSELVIKHNFFEGIDFAALRNQTLPSPWIPMMKSESNEGLDTPYFENWDHLAKDPELCIFKDAYPRLTRSEQMRFQGLDECDVSPKNARAESTTTIRSFTAKGA